MTSIVDFAQKSCDYDYYLVPKILNGRKNPNGVGLIIDVIDHFIEV
jgi:hypothetical protein